jgi:hypothetical protein
MERHGRIVKSGSRELELSLRVPIKRRIQAVGWVELGKRKARVEVTWRQRLSSTAWPFNTREGLRVQIRVQHFKL